MSQHCWFLTQALRLNLTRTISQRLGSNRPGLARDPLHDLVLLLQGNVRKCNRGHSRALTGNGLRQHAKSSVNPLPATTEVTVTQLSHADDEPGHNGAYSYIGKQAQKEHRGAVYCIPVLDDRSNIEKDVPISSSEESDGTVNVWARQARESRMSRGT